MDRKIINPKESAKKFSCDFFDRSTTNEPLLSPPFQLGVKKYPIVQSDPVSMSHALAVNSVRDPWLAIRILLTWNTLEAFAHRGYKT